ncbi:hypothetical protein FRC98_13590 [Lujinxingia vulgaris]|uniref:Uncharacterized protein n=1 Tax=Lujinxingia vulgaris TaxID=2600176 RepID=A0A5C6X7B6_9DELT|nr:hypothetical protein [Lujinxingia vulgaris]TXD36150.1 hypothetical protein FRC98_13590 [Lujinxingia vulgaris]
MKTMLPDYIIYDQLKKERARQQEQAEQRPQLEIPRPLPYWPEQERESPKPSEDRAERGVEIIQM